jgi:predicted protein tyrosine phosphatase
MYVQCNNEVRSRNHCQRGKARSVIYTVIVALVTQRAKRFAPLYCRLSVASTDCATFSHIAP